MEKELFEYVEPRIKKLSKSFSAAPEVKAAAKAWMEAVTADEAAADDATAAFLDAIDGKVETIDEAIEYAKGPGMEMFGLAGGQVIVAKLLAAKDAGAKWCDCEVCTAMAEILAKFDRIEL